MRLKIVFRQFHVEGFVNQYVTTNISADGKTIVFTSESMAGQPAFRCPSLSPTSCVLGEAGPNEVTFYSFVPVPGAVKTEIFRIKTDHADGVAWDLSPDGSQIAYAEYSWQSASIHIRDVTT